MNPFLSWKAQVTGPASLSAELQGSALEENWGCPFLGAALVGGKQWEGAEMNKIQGRENFHLLLFTAQLQRGKKLLGHLLHFQTHIEVELHKWFKTPA